MHNENIVHRDLKPENILLTKTHHNAKVTDFGLSNHFQKGKSLSLAIGTALYMAPEIVKEEKYDEKIDIWGVGIIAHLVLCGQVPFNGNT